MNLIELHILQSFPVTCLNRDDLGAPKSALFGGTERARVSSQCWKRAIREKAKELNSKYFQGIRGHFISEMLSRNLIQKGVEEPQADAIAEKVVTVIAGKDKKYKGKSQVALFFSPEEIEAIADACIEEINKINDIQKISFKKGNLKKAISNANAKDIADIALFGRMVANDHSLMIESAAMFSHALSTHKISNEIDFFSAIDETQPEESEGAGHIGTIEYNSACYYRYVGVNLDMLADEEHLEKLDQTEIKKVLEAFINASIIAVPSARKNSMFGFNPPSYVLGLRRKGQPLSLVNAFEKPIKPSHTGFIETSQNEMRKHYDNLFKTFELENDVSVEISIPEKNINEFIKNLLGD